MIYFLFPQSQGTLIHAFLGLPSYHELFEIIPYRKVGSWMLNDMGTPRTNFFKRPVILVMVEKIILVVLYSVF